MFHSLALHAASLLLSAPSLPLADFHVDVNAANCTTGTGGPADPVCSIGAAIALASSGDTIRIAPGTYFENVVLNFDLDLIGTGGADVTIIDGGANGSVVTIPTAVTVTIDGLTLTNGRADYGGGIQVEGNVIVRNSKVNGNRVVGAQGLGGPDWGGGAIGSINGGGGMPVSPVPQITIENSTLSGNVANFPTGDVFLSGGAIYVRFGDLRISNSTISGNTSREGGGGIVKTLGYMNITNSTISGNVSQRGPAGGLYDHSLPGSILNHVTITDNHAPSAHGGGLHARFSLAVQNSVIAGNTALTAPDMYGCFNSLGHNIVGSVNLDFSYCVNFPNALLGDQAGTLELPIDPRLGPLANNGGPTETHLPLFGSPLIGTADPLQFEALDQRGVVRPIGGTPDIGAVEFDGILESLCNGDGGNQLGCTNCPCGNNSPLGTVGGCTNSATNSTRLAVTGSPSVSLPAMLTTDLRFALTGAPPLSLAILNSGDALASSNPASPCFGLGSGVQSAEFDGLRCAVSNTRRHGSRAASSVGSVGDTNAPWGGEGEPALGLAQAFGGFAAGQVRYFQAIYRDDPLSVCMRGLNTSQAVRVTFEP